MSKMVQSKPKIITPDYYHVDGVSPLITHDWKNLVDNGKKLMVIGPQIFFKGLTEAGERAVPNIYIQKSLVSVCSHLNNLIFDGLEKNIEVANSDQSFTDKVSQLNEYFENIHKVKDIITENVGQAFVIYGFECYEEYNHKAIQFLKKASIPHFLVTREDPEKNKSIAEKFDADVIISGGLPRNPGVMKDILIAYEKLVKSKQKS
jgi:hypothetical protein